MRASHDSSFTPEYLLGAGFDIILALGGWSNPHSFLCRKGHDKQ
jgi:hypothetical protein